MRNFPTDPMVQNNLLIAAFCDDLFDLCVNRKPGNDTPRADRIAEIARQTNQLHEIDDAHDSLFDGANGACIGPTGATGSSYRLTQFNGDRS
jgi:hypothetical protein